jgi:benzil reductase ((S)-benzoin forming)
MTFHNAEVVESACKGAVFVVTGPTSGLGFAMYEVLRSHHASVIAVGRNIERLARAGEQAADEAIAAIEADFQSPDRKRWLEQVHDALVHALNETSQKTLVFVNNAGSIEPLGAAIELDFDAVELAMRINFVSPLALAAMMAQLAAERGRRLRIVNITTGAARRPIGGWLPYCASKAACQIALDVLAVENPDVELRHIDPGIIDTEMQARIRDKGRVTAFGLPPSDATQLRSPLDAAFDVLVRALGDIQ